MRTAKPLLLAGVLVSLVSLVSCGREDPGFTQGYVEGEFVYVASPYGGQLVTLSIERGVVVEAGAPLFELDATPERAARDEVARRVDQARASLEDTKRGQRPTELDSIRAQLEQARAAETLSEREFNRQKGLRETGAVPQRDLDEAESRLNQDKQRVLQLAATLETAQLGSRDRQIAAAEENLKAQEAALAGAEWRLQQKSQSAPVAGLVSEVMYRKGDWVGAGQPVVELLPPGNIHVRAFVGQAAFGRLQVGDEAEIHVDGVAEPYRGMIRFLSPRAEYTPPVIYSQQMREKLVFMVQLSLLPEDAAELHPGQPVDVRFHLR